LYRGEGKKRALQKEGRGAGTNCFEYWSGEDGGGESPSQKGDHGNR